MTLLYNFKSVIKSLNDIRNCLSHSSGIVRPQDGQKDEENYRKFKWIIFSASVRGNETGKIYELEVGKSYDEDATIILELTEHERRFKVGQQLSFKTLDIYEMAFTLQRITHAIFNELNSKIATTNPKENPAIPAGAGDVVGDGGQATG